MSKPPLAPPDRPRKGDTALVLGVSRATTTRVSVDVPIEAIPRTGDIVVVMTDPLPLSELPVSAEIAESMPGRLFNIVHLRGIVVAAATSNLIPLRAFDEEEKADGRKAKKAD